MTRRVYLDTEFVPNLVDWRGTLSVGMVDNEGRVLYFENRDAHWQNAVSEPWIAEHVMPHMQFGHLLLHVDEQRKVVEDFFSHAPRDDTIVYAWCGAQDLVRIHGLWDHDWDDMPDCIPHWFQDAEAYNRDPSFHLSDRTPVAEAPVHNALNDAKYLRQLVEAYLGPADGGVGTSPRMGR